MGGRTGWTPYRLSPQLSTGGRTRSAIATPSLSGTLSATFQRRAVLLSLGGRATPCLRNVTMLRAKSTRPPKASDAPLHREAGPSSAGANAVTSPRSPAVPAGMYAAPRTSPQRPSPHLMQPSRGAERPNAPKRIMAIATLIANRICCSASVKPHRAVRVHDCELSNRI